MNKFDLREVIKTRVSKLTSSDIDNKSRQVSALLEELLTSFEQVPQNLGCYYPLKNEVDLLSFFKITKIETSYPFIKSDVEMVFKTSSSNELESKAFFGKNFKIPGEEKKEVIPDIILVPGLAFDNNGNRLGRGKGYYDRYLSNKEIVKIGIGFHEQFVEEVPVDELDIAMDFVITDLEIVKVNNRRER